MSIMKKKENTTPSLEDKMKDQAKKHDITLVELKKLYEGKKCPKYANAEILHCRKVKGGKLVVFNISDKLRSEKISIGRKKLKSNED